MSRPRSIFFDLMPMVENDETVKSWKNQVIETENLIKSMQNDLEVEQAKETLLLTEMRGKILRVEQLTLRSSQQANERLQNLMVDQLVEIKKREILVKVNIENYKQCASSLQEFPLREPHLPELVVTGHVSQEKESEIQFQDKGEEELKDEERKAIEDAIAESEKEHAILKEFLTEHQRLLTEIESVTKPEIPESRKGSCNKEDNITVPQSTVTPTQLQEPVLYQWDQNTRSGARAAAPSNSDPAPSCSIPRSKVSNRTFEAKSAIISKKVGHIQKPIYLPKDSNEDFGIEYLSSESVKPRSTTEPTPPMKQARLNLYDTPGASQTSALRSQAPLAKSNTTFKPKIPSMLRNQIN